MNHVLALALAAAAFIGASAPAHAAIDCKPDRYCPGLPPKSGDPVQLPGTRRVLSQSTATPVLKR